MAAKVLYKQGTKKTYLGLTERLSTALYFCTDTRELFKGDDLYSDGLRLVANYEALPAFETAADGILYVCEDSGCGWVLNAARDGWIQVVYGVDGETIEVGTNGLMAVKAIGIEKVTNLTEELRRIEALAISGGAQVPIATKEVAGIVKPGDELTVAQDGTLSLQSVALEKVTGLNERLTAIEAAAVGGVRYCGGVATFEDLPTDAKQGDLYEVYADNSEWCYNGTEWFEYGKTTDIDLTAYATKDEVYTVARLVDYEIFDKPVGTLVNHSDGEIRVMCPADTDWVKRASGENADPNAYYIGFKAYAPSDDAVSFKEDLAEIIVDSTMYYFEDNEFAGIDEYGRKYSIVWLPAALYNETTGEWLYYGASSTADKYVGWYYSVEWYNEDGVKIAADTIRINLANEDCQSSSVPFYVADIQAELTALKESASWGDI